MWNTFPPSLEWRDQKLPQIPLQIPAENNLSAPPPITERRMADAGLRTALLETIAGLMATDQVPSAAAIGSNSFSKGKLFVNGRQEARMKRCTVSVKDWIQVARSRAEEQVKALEVTDEFGLHLAELTLQVSIQLNPLWKRFCKSHLERWSPPSATVGLSSPEAIHWRPLEPRCRQVPTTEIFKQCEFYRFRPPEAPQATKASIRAMLPHGLKESISKVSPFQVLWLLLKAQPRFGTQWRSAWQQLRTGTGRMPGPNFLIY